MRRLAALLFIASPALADDADPRGIYTHAAGIKQWCRRPALAIGCPRVSPMEPAEKVTLPGRAESFCRTYVGAPKCLVSGRWEGRGVRTYVVYRVDEVR